MSHPSRSGWSRRGRTSDRQPIPGFGPRIACDQSVIPQPIRVRTKNLASQGGRGLDPLMKGLILAQNERWRRGLGMQVERARLRPGQWRKGE